MGDRWRQRNADPRGAARDRGEQSYSRSDRNHYRPSHDDSGDYGHDFHRNAHDRRASYDDRHYNDHFERPNGRENRNNTGFTFRGAAGAQQYDFDFRVRGPAAPVFRQESPHRGQPPRKRQHRDRPDRIKRPERRNWQPKPPTHERKILQLTSREKTPDQLVGMSNSVPRFSDVAGVDVTMDDETKSKLQEAKQNAPRWSNPDPYTSLPPVGADLGPKKDIVGAIRKAKRDAAAAVNQKNGTDIDADFISFDHQPSNIPDFQPARMGPYSPPRPQKQSDSFHLRLVTNIPAEKKPLKRSPIYESEEEIEKAFAKHKAMKKAEALSLFGEKALDADVESVVETSTTSILPGREKRKRASDSESDPNIDTNLRPFDVEEVLLLTNDWQAEPNVDDAPWFRPHPEKAVPQSPAARLHEEIVDWYEYVRPTSVDRAVRLDLIDRLRMAIRNFGGFREAVEVHAFGSFATGLYLPCADMDLVVLSPTFISSGEASVGSTNSQLRHFGRYLENSRMTVRGSVQTILYARVPLVKYTDKITGLKVDISFENPSGLYAINTVHSWIQTYPTLRPLVLIIKQLLVMRGLSEVHSGGLGGFSVICLVVSMLQLMPGGPEDSSFNQQGGFLFSHFLTTYGSEFDITATGISFKPPGYFNKEDTGIGNAERLTIIDPNNGENDISVGTKKVQEIFDMFQAVHSKLQARLESVRCNPHDRDSILACVLGGNYGSYVNARLLCFTAYEEMQREHIVPSDRPLPYLGNMPTTIERRIARPKGPRGQFRGRGHKGRT